MTNETETLTSGIDPASFSSVIKPTNDLFRYVNGPWIDTYRLPDDRSRYGSFDKLAEDAENQVRDILDADDCPAVKSSALYRSFLNTDAIEAAGLDPIRDELDLIDSAIDKAALTRVLGTINPAGGPTCSAWPFTATRATRTATSPTLSRPAFVCRMKPTIARITTLPCAKHTWRWSPPSW